MTATYPPGPRGRFLTGSLREFRQDLLGFLTRSAAEFGDLVTFRVGPKRIVLVMLRDAGAEQFVDSIDAGLDANHTEAELEKIQPQIDELFAKIRAIGEAKKGMRIVLDYSPKAASTMLYIDGTAQGEPMHGQEFFRALLRIWLGERPAEEELKRLLLRQEVNGKE